jgi:hypothetical protein
VLAGGGRSSLLFGLGGSAREKRFVRSRTRAAVLGLLVGGLVAGSLTPVPAAETAATGPAVRANAPKPGDFGAAAAKSADVALDGWG